MKISNEQTKLFDFVKEQHGDQKRKYTDLPYWTHLWSVAQIVSEYPDVEMGIEIALCHDLLEDTQCDYRELNLLLRSIGYREAPAYKIVLGVIDLTDVYTSEKYPQFNRAKRKQLEAKRLINITPNAQSVKYADIIDNTSSIVHYDPAFAKVYLQEISNKIHKMDKGNPVLYQRCLETVESAINNLVGR